MQLLISCLQATFSSSIFSTVSISKIIASLLKSFHQMTEFVLHLIFSGLLFKLSEGI
jgi:hypothetical protein